jgi:hypothetical protein
MGHWRKFFEEKYLGAWVMDDAGRDLTVEIERLQIEEVMNPDTNSKEKKLVVHFRGKKKGMVCNKTNARTVAALYGDNTDEWIGKRITLYATTITAFGKEHRCIRIKDRVPQQQPPHDPETGEVQGAHEPQPEPGKSVVSFD